VICQSQSSQSWLGCGCEKRERQREWIVYRYRSNVPENRVEVISLYWYDLWIQSDWKKCLEKKRVFPLACRVPAKTCRCRIDFRPTNNMNPFFPISNERILSNVNVNVNHSFIYSQLRTKTDDLRQKSLYQLLVQGLFISNGWTWIYIKKTIKTYLNNKHTDNFVEIPNITISNCFIFFQTSEQNLRFNLNISSKWHNRKTATIMQ
jgi:hypothetical protein